MKTIEEIAIHFANENNTLEASWGGCEDEWEWDHINKAVKDAVEFAQRWIPVEEELPNCNINSEGIFYSEYILLKIKGYNHPYVGFYVKTDDDEFFDLIHLRFGEYIKREDITHWRPIEIK